jgi:hypothetical protein
VIIGISNDNGPCQCYIKVMKISRAHRFFILGVLSLTVLASCEVIVPFPSNLFDEETIARYRSELTPEVPYLSENYSLPQLATNSDLFQVTWSADGYVVQEGVFQYVSPLDDEAIILTATLTSNGESTTLPFAITVKSQLQVPHVAARPTIRIQLPQGIQEEDLFYEDYTRATASIQHDAHGVYQTTNITSPLGIRTRGHSTRFMPKRPYRIRFDENTSLFGMKSAKNYILLANYIDRSMVRNSLMVYMSKLLDSSMYTLDYRFVDLYLNQHYRGQYLLIERVEFQKNRLDIEPNLALDDAGFMIELDYQVYVQNQGNENLEWFKVNDKPYVIKEPNPISTVGYQSRHTQFMSNYFNNMRNALINRSNYETYIDVDNWIDYFLIQEIAKNVDVGWGSVYMVKETGGKLKHMPLWDFDLAFGNADYIPYGPDGHWGWANDEKNELFTLMMKIPAIRTRFKEKLIAYETSMLPALINYLNENESPLGTLSQSNFAMWPMNQCEGWCPIPEPLREMTTINQQFTYLRNFLTQRFSWMKSNI